MARPTIAIALSLAGVACGLTLLFLGMRSVMNVGGFCAEGGPYEISQHCPQGVPAVMVGSIWGGVILAFVYVWHVIRRRVPSFALLLWPALFLSLGWNFFEYAFDPPGAGGGIVWGWLICGIVFLLMGGLPLLAVLPATVRGFTRDDEHPQGWPVGMPLAHMQRVVGRVQPRAWTLVSWTSWSGWPSSTSSARSPMTSTRRRSGSCSAGGRSEHEQAPLLARRAAGRRRRRHLRRLATLRVGDIARFRMRPGDARDRAAPQPRAAPSGRSRRTRACVS